jgi:signal transduction histidine kinase
MAKMIVEQTMGGSLLLKESRPGHTCFELTIPCRVE